MFLLLSSCCREDPIETARYELTANELALVPYQKDETINFIHSNGYTFDFTVTEDNLEWKEHHDFCEWNCCGNSYFSYQVKSIVLESDYPNFNIRIFIGDNIYADDYPPTLNISLNYDHTFGFEYDSLANFICDTVTQIKHYDSLSLNNRNFYDVYSKDFDGHGLVSDSSAILPQTLFLNDSGIIQIKMSNNETYTINN